MARGVKKHMKRMWAPSHWMLDKLRGVWAPRPSTGPHKLRQCMPLIVLLRNRLKYALTYNEVKMIVMQRLIKVDGKVRTDMSYPAGLMDVISIEKTKEHFRLLWDTKGRFAVHKIHPDEATYKLCAVRRIATSKGGFPYAVTHDGRTIRFIDPEVKSHDTVRVDIASGKVLDHIKFELGTIVMATGGNNIGRVGTLMHREKHPGSFEIVHVKDSAGHTFATRLSNVMCVGGKSKDGEKKADGPRTWISLPKGNGIRLNVVEDREARLSKNCA